MINDTSGDTAWFNDEEMRIWRGFVQASGLLVSQLTESLKAKAGLTLDDYEVLVHLSEADDRRLRMAELSQRLLHSQSRSTQRVDRLVKKGLVCREKCSDDGRGTFACMTDEGIRAIEAIAPIHVHDVRRLLIDLIEPSERAVIADVLERVALAARATTT